jgi:hypothetical protein
METLLPVIRRKHAAQSKRSVWLVPWRAKDGHCGAIAFSRNGYPALGDFDDAVILKQIGDVDIGLLSD